MSAGAYSQQEPPPLTADELLGLLPHLTPEEAQEIDELLTSGLPIWLQQVGPQWDALESPADIVYYGGQAGGGKTDLLIGAATTRHRQSILFRREAVQLVHIVQRTTQILQRLGGRRLYNGQDDVFRMPDGRVIELGSVKEPDDWMKYMGRPHDLVCFDELPHFTELQFRALIGWCRSDDPKQRQRVIAAGNPPTTSEGEWVIRYFAPWLDETHPNPAKPGELRWFVTDDDGRDKEVPDDTPLLIRGKWTRPKSRTFISASVDDNLYYSSTGYRDTLMALPEPLRSQMALGSFSAGRADHEWQMVPTAWIKAAQARWEERADKGVMTALGFDVARGGIDKSTIARRHGTWFDRLVQLPGVVTDDGPKAAAFVVPLVRNGAPICIDAIGVGGSGLDFLVGLGLNVVPVIGSERSTGSDKSGRLRFKNVRAQMYWALREALDPTAQSPIALPPDPELLGDLAAVRYKIVIAGTQPAIQARSKDEIIEALGRSPDKGDAVAMTFADVVASEGPGLHESVRRFKARPRVRDWRAR